MPLYEFECDVCAHRFERIQKFSDANPDACPKCGGKVHKLLSSPAIQFKGSGFYLTDYGRSGSKTDSANVKSGKNESGSTGDGKSGDSKSSDSKAGDSSSSSKSDSSSSDSAAKPSTPPAKAD